MRYDIIRPLVNFGLQIVYFGQTIGRAGMTFGKTRHADAEAAWVGMDATRIEFLDEGDQVGGAMKSIRAAVMLGATGRHVAAERENVGDIMFGVPLQHTAYLVFRVAHAGQVRDRVALGRLLEPDNQIVRALPRRASRAVCHGDKRRMQGFQFGDITIELFCRHIVLGREKFKTEGGAPVGEGITDVHNFLRNPTNQSTKWQQDDQDDMVYSTRYAFLPRERFLYLEKSPFVD